MQIRNSPLPLLLLAAAACAAQQPESASVTPARTTAAPVRANFHVRYVNGSNVYIDAGRDAGLRPRDGT